MTEYSGPILAEGSRKSRISKLRPWVVVLAPLIAILFQVMFPQLISYLSYLELPLLVTVYFSLSKRSPMAGTLFGAAVGLTQDSLSHQPIGMFGIVKTLVGYFAGSVSLRFDVENSLSASSCPSSFSFSTSFFTGCWRGRCWAKRWTSALQQTFVFGLLNAAVPIPVVPDLG